MDRRRFLKSAAGLFIPVAPALILPKFVRAQGGMGPGPGMVHSTGGGGTTSTFDASSQKAWSSVGTTPQTWTHTPVGTPTGIIIGIVNFSANTLPSAVTYNGVSLGAAAVSQVNVYGASSGFAAIYGLASPASGPQTASITLSNPSGNFGFAFAMSVTGSDLATIFRSTNGATAAASTSISNTVAGSAANDLVVDFANANTGTDTIASPGAGQASITIIGRTDAKFSYKTAAGASETMTWTLSPSSSWWSNAVSVKHA